MEWLKINDSDYNHNFDIALLTIEIDLQIQKPRFDEWRSSIQTKLDSMTLDIWDKEFIGKAADLSGYPRSEKYNINFVWERFQY